ncbi:unnamed protein product [Phytomonas sp. EM1]|nr:unnamed protein product [Phytomonas sp. EM1]|eukprot:CCW62950.1 unnamed protein product [Phytomonas sp. isolate EM1]
MPSTCASSGMKWGGAPGMSTVRQRARLLQRKGLSLMRLTNPRLSESDSKAVMSIVGQVLKIQETITNDVDKELGLANICGPVKDDHPSSPRCDSPSTESASLPKSDARDSIHGDHPSIPDSLKHENPTILLTIPILSHFLPALFDKEFASFCPQSCKYKTNNRVENTSHAQIGTHGKYEVHKDVYTSI